MITITTPVQTKIQSLRTTCDHDTTTQRVLNSALSDSRSDPILAMTAVGS
jgi:hypothetical protein